MPNHRKSWRNMYICCLHTLCYLSIAMPARIRQCHLLYRIFFCILLLLLFFFSFSIFVSSFICHQSRYISCWFLSLVARYSRTLRQWFLSIVNERMIRNKYNGEWRKWIYLKRYDAYQWYFLSAFYCFDKNDAIFRQNLPLNSI